MTHFKRLPDSELDVMLIVWQRGEAIPTGDIVTAVNRKKKATLQMVQSTLNRLLDKGYLGCDKIGRLNYYTALVDVEEYRAMEASSFVERLYDNSPSKLFVTLLRHNTVSPEELEELRQILDGEER